MLCYMYIIARVLARVLHKGEMMERKQVNIRLPKYMVQCIKNQALLLGVHQSALYTIALYDYLIKRGLIDVKGKDRTGNIC